MSLGWWTDIEVARRSGSQIVQRGGVFVVRTPQNPGYYWGNYVLVAGRTPPEAARSLFAREFPNANHVAIGFLDRPDEKSWAPWPIEVSEVLAQNRSPEADTVPGYTVRALSAADWRQAWRNEVADQSQAYADFAWRRIQARQTLVQRGDGLFVGAFHGDALAADLGIVLCGSVARYQSVFTHPDHRQRGLASWLLAAAGRWAGQRGVEQWVIIAEPDSAASRLYSAAGFTLAERAFQVERTG